MNCLCTSYAFYALGVAAIYLGIQYFKKQSLQKKLDRWSSTPKDVVIVHGFPAAKTIPNSSPFIMKVLTYLRLANIPYKMDTTDMYGPKGKAPWISLNGQHKTDSQFIVEFLGKKFEKQFKGAYTDEQLAIATAVRVMLEDHTSWGFGLDRFIFTRSGTSLIKMNIVYRFLMSIFVTRRKRETAIAQGIGRHSEEEVVAIITADLNAVSKILGNKKFILGDEPCEDDCAIFGVLSQAVWALPGSPYERLLNNELKNLKDYCFRMKVKYWADWDHCLVN